MAQTRKLAFSLGIVSIVGSYDELNMVVGSIPRLCVYVYVYVGVGVRD